ncbi:MAG TPA: hypothetical protein VMF06_25365 [Candidatus Limnocylindria bacterium]|nr:hypothetical protein [Candidatus Limnocylindria bacterium]
MNTQVKRGSEKLLAAWKARALTEESVKEIAEALDKSPAKVEGANVVGGTSATGVQVSLRYDGDDTPLCGNDILFWLKWHRIHGGAPRPPRIIINGIPFPEIIRLDLDFGHVDVQGSLVQDIAGKAGGGFAL